MKLVEFVPPVKHPLWKLCLQMGITEVIVKVNPSLTGLPDPWKYETLKRIVDGLKAEGLRVVGLEGDPFDMSPIKEYGAINGRDARCPSAGGANGRDARCPGEGGDPTGTTAVSAVDRETALARYRELLESMSRLDIHLLCYNFMVGPGWSRTGVRKVRGGALATYFNKSEYEASFNRQTGTTGVSPVDSGRSISFCNGQDARCPSDGDASGQDARCPSDGDASGQDARCPGDGDASGQDARCPGDGDASGQDARCPGNELLLTKDQVWANYEYFIKAVMPTAEKAGVRMGLHPDDPCLPSLGGYARIFETVADFDRAYEIFPSPSNAVTFCQANFKLMLIPTCNGHDARCPSGGGTPTGTTGVSPVDLVTVAKHFGNRIAFIHVRDVEGDRTDFTELFHDQGTTDQFALMRTYRELGLDVPVRGDHVPEMEGDRKLVEDAIPGYFNMGRLFANGYLKALLKGTEK